MNRKIWIIVIIGIIVALMVFLEIMYLVDLNRMKDNKPVIFSTWGKNYEEPKKPKTDNMSIVLSLEDKITDNSAWCGTFNLIWNDLKNDLAKQDIVFNPQLDFVRNLNKGTFNTSHLSKDSYYKVYGPTSLELKKEIEEAIKEKFNETSDILDDFDWTLPDGKSYFLYAMLKKEFEFPKVFTQLENGTFGNYQDVKYFGINKTTDEQVRNQVQVLYYNSKEDFAVKLLTKGNDEVIISRGTKQDTFEKVYEEIVKNSENYKGVKSFKENDTLKIPNISFNLKEEIEELKGKSVESSNVESYTIEKAMQTIKFELDKKGGKIKSEAGIMTKDSAMSVKYEDPREFIADNTFTIFLKEKDKSLPYFAAKISNIKDVQE